MNASRWILGGWMTLVMTLAGCTREAPPPTAAAAPVMPRQIAFTATNEVVAVQDVQVRDKAKSVTADFNMDGLKDLAVVSQVDEQSNEMAIYIRRPQAKKSSPAEKTIDSYFKAASLRDSINGRVVGIANRTRDQYTDLVVLIRHPDGGTEMLQYENDGGQFTLVPNPSAASLQP